MTFGSGWTRQEINSLTYKELIEQVQFLYEIEAEKNFQWFKYFCVYNCESSSVAFAGKPDEYIKKVLTRNIRKEEELNDLDSQFKGADFGK